MSDRQMNRRRQYLILGLVSVIGAGVFSFLLFPRLVEPLKVYYLRADGYYDIAENLLAGKGFHYGEKPGFDTGAFKREPLYPLFLAAIMKTGSFLPILISIQILIYLLTVWTAYSLFLKFGNPVIAFWASLLFASYPYSYWYVAKPTPENITPLLLLINVLLCHNYISERDPKFLFLWGITSAACVLSKSNLLLAVLVGLGVIWLRMPKSWKLVGHSAVCLIIFLACLSPWVIRNYRLSEKFIWGSSMFGTVFFVGNVNADWATVKDLATHQKGENEITAEWKRIYDEKKETGPPEQRENQFLLEAAVDTEFARRVGPWIFNNKMEFLKKLLINLPTMWFITTDKIKSILLLVFQTGLIFTCIYGVWLTLRQKITTFELHALLLMFAMYVANAAIFADARFTHVVLPFIAYFSAVGLGNILRSRFGPRPSAAIEHPR